jgi:hypothetical protein
VTKSRGDRALEIVIGVVLCLAALSGGVLAMGALKACQEMKMPEMPVIRIQLVPPRDRDGGP